MYEKLLSQAHDQNIDVYEKPLSSKIKGLYSNKIIWINRNIESSTDKACVLAEELGHYHTSVGDILDQSSLPNRKQEKRARNWAYKKLIPLEKLISASNEGVKNKYELAEYLGVNEPFLEESLKRYKEEYGLFTLVKEKILYFDPLGVLDMKNF
ncbi:ImmA/IrrE family metallo-endopeptidase [Lederbergia sp. NSJ-179]|uniref:ImmA/IrrE family metallo-endopeptidase n=1 Tax=Lederbergia sp. NSJ-179 TaxID=2931402 RepID=UPI001FD54C34|nr:ImmA/IrrE family metallo-endopeptidase [Lederbergia sp. NSJ-179]MCJ7839949.1 ImmA/IrrE family metallo-endopeptidase [Lederbergia sp. NSJ-179]